MNIREFALRFYGFSSAQFGVDPLKMLRCLRGLPRYVRDLLRFRASYSGPFVFFPCLHDWHDEGGTATGEYFWQDLYVARKINAANPEKHVDIGSRVDGFVAHVASFREIEVFDIRPMSARVPGMIFKQADLMNLDPSVTDYCDSLSCLHALEHFGLGRYGDPIDPKGYESGIRDMARIVRTGGVFYLSMPVGVERVEFNALQVLNPKTIVDAAERNGLVLREFSTFDGDKGIVTADATSEGLALVGREQYRLGIFTFVKT